MARCDPLPESPGGVAEQVQAILSRPEERLDYAEAKLALDRIVDPAIDRDATMAELDRLADGARKLAGSQPNEAALLAALRRLIYQSGPWNDYRPFDYDHSNVRGADVRMKLISHYLDRRLGDCVSMPVLFLILADKLGLDMALVSAPNHIFLRHIDASGRVTNLEATSGADPARDEWIRKIRPMTDRAVESGLYMRTLGRREGVALMATIVLQGLMDERRYGEAVNVSGVILEHGPKDGLTLANRGNACERILRRDFLDRYGIQFLVPIHLQPRYQWLWACNHAAFAAAADLGWRHEDSSVPQEQRRSHFTDPAIAA